ELELVIGDGVTAAVRFEAEIGGVAGEDEGDAGLEIGEVDGVGELDRGDDLLLIRIEGVLVELALGYFGFEGDAVEAEGVVLEKDAGGEEGLAVEGNGEGLVDGPVVPGGEDEVAIVGPPPLAGHFGGEVDAPCEGLVDL